MRIRKFFLFLCLFFLLFSLSSYLTQDNILANTILFQDNFDDGNANGWDEYDGWGGWQVRQLVDFNYVYEGTVILHGHPEDPAYTTNGSNEWSNYVFEVDIKGVEGVDKVVCFRFRSINERYCFNIVSLWSSGGNIIDLYKRSPLHTGHLIQLPFVNHPNRWYRLKTIITSLDQDTTNIKLFIKDLDNNIDHGLVLDFNDTYHPINSGSIGLFMWPGGYTGIGDVTTTQFDNIVVSGLIPSPTPTPTPTPSLSPDPIILLPGLGASWNHRAMVLNENVDQEDWYMPPFVKAYDGLIQTLKNANYNDTGPDRNLFIFNYDWRQSIESTANQLNDYIENTVDPPDGTKIDLIGHSLGGMIARTYIQHNPDHQIDQLITLGSPHRGAPQVYYLWEGADLNRALFPPWQRIGAGLLLQLYKRNFENSVETIQRAISVLQDLLPTFLYLKQNGIEKPLSEMIERNEWLGNLNTSPLPGFLISVLNNIVGLKGETPRWINVVPRNRFDQLLGKWVDGTPIGEEYEIGDLTVLAESAQLEGANVVELPDLDHGELVETPNGQQAIIDLLGLSPSSVVSAPDISYEPALVFQLASPAIMTIFGPDGWQIGEGVVTNIPDGIYSPNDKLIIIPHPKEGGYHVQIDEEGSGGSFRLLIGKLLPAHDIWQEFEGETTEEPRIFTTVFSQDPSQNKLELLKLAKQRLNLLRQKILQSDCLFKRFLASVVRWKIRQIERAIRLLQRGREERALKEIETIIFSLANLEKNLKFWARLCRFSPEFQQELIEDIRITKDYLLQVYEFE